MTSDNLTHKKKTNRLSKKTNRLSLTSISDKDGLFQGKKSNGVIYTVRADRHKYFFPDEWIKFLSELEEDKKILFETLLQTGGRINEVLNLKPSDFIWDTNSLTLRVTKTKAKKGESKVLGGKRRSFVVSSQYIRKLRKYIRDKNINNDSYLFPITKQAVSQLFKRTLKKIGMKEWEYSLHNIRKTSGMWLKTVQRRGVDLDVSEICMRLGHDHDTFIKHYGSPSVFTDQQRDKIIDILGDIYKLR
jgi:integrase